MSRRLNKIEKEIRAAQSSTKPLIPKSCFKRLVDEYVGDKRISKDALTILQEEAENMLTEKLYKANKVAQSCKRDTVTAKHLQLVSELE